MKKLVLSFFVIIFINAKAQFTQTVQSSCVGADSIKTKYRKDACRLAVRRVYHINSNYKDSILPQKTLRGDYLKALMAVYNATALPVRDTIVKLLNLHTNPSPELNSLSVKATGTLNWMQNLLNSTIPVGNVFIDFLINKYYLYPGSYYQSVNFDVAVLKSDSCLNTSALARSFTVIPGVIGAEVTDGIDDSKNITDSINPNYIGLTYTYGWGTCNNGCDYKLSWHFKIYNNCVVEYNGSDGDPLDTGIDETNFPLNQVQLYPNPANETLNIDYGLLDYKKVKLSLYNSLGQKIEESPANEFTQTINLSAKPAGVYQLKIENNLHQKTFRIIKQ